MFAVFIIKCWSLGDSIFQFFFTNILFSKKPENADN